MSHIMSEQNPSSERNHHLSAAPSAPAPTMATGHRRGRGSGGTNIKALSRAHTSAQWKESLRKSCLERAKHARMERLRKSRLINVSFDNSAASSNAASLNLLPPEEGCNINNNRLKRGRDDEVEDIDWCGINNYNQVEVINNGRANVTEDCNLGVDSPLISSPIDGQTRTSFSQLQEDSNMREGDDDEMKEENIVDTAKALVEQELQRALSGVQHCRALLTRSTRARDDDIDYSISHEEFLELLNDVTEEMQREDELLEEEIWEMERAEAMERERLMHQIDDYESWEELEQYKHSQPSTYTSPFQSLDSPLVTCPICSSSSLMESPQHGIICTSVLGPNPMRCAFQLNIAHEGLTLHHLQNQLRAIYEEHSQVCLRGTLVFRVESRAGVSMLMAKCNVCSSDVVVL